MHKSSTINSTSISFMLMRSSLSRNSYNNLTYGAHCAPKLNYDRFFMYVLHTRSELNCSRVSPHLWLICLFDRFFIFESSMSSFALMKGSSHSIELTHVWHPHPHIMLIEYLRWIRNNLMTLFLCLQWLIKLIPSFCCVYLLKFSSFHRSA